MLDDLRNSSSFIDDEEPQNQEDENSVHARPLRRRQNAATFMGMTAQQRFIISLMLFFMVCILGVFALAIAGSIAIP